MNELVSNVIILYTCRSLYLYTVYYTNVMYLPVILPSIHEMIVLQCGDLDVIYCYSILPINTIVIS